MNTKANKYRQSVIAVGVVISTIFAGFCSADQSTLHQQEFTPSLLHRIQSPSSKTPESSSSKYGPFIGQFMSLKKQKYGTSVPADFVRTKLGGMVQVYIVYIDLNDTELQYLKDLEVEIEVINRNLNTVQGWLSESDIELLAKNSNVLKIKAPSYAKPRIGQFNTEADAIIRSDKLRLKGLSGAGIKVGIVSDGSNDIASAQLSLDLPQNVTQLGSCTTRARDNSNCTSQLTCNEGTAMAEIIHDIAPDAELAVAAVSTSLEFIQRINELATTFQADIIVDDLGFFGEPFFEDGPLAQAVENLPENILYVSSAGNSGNIHYEQQFQSSNSLGITAHAFANNDDAIGFLIPARGFTVPILQWNEEFDSPNSNYDMIIVNQTEVVGRSQADQLAGQPAFEAICIPNNTNDNVINSAIVQKVSGADRRIEMFFLGSGAIEYPVPEGSVFGHAGTNRALAVGAINASEPNNDEIAFYSSRGPARLDFPSIENRAKPDITGIDGVLVSGAGGFPSPFFGTSAAAPHVAGIAALLMSGSNTARATKIKLALTRGTIDLGTPGFDNTYGHGRVDALLARSAFVAPTVVPPITILLDDD